MSTGYISTSMFELFKIGPGPSSSHTLAPMLAGNDFLSYVQSELSCQELDKVTRIVVKLFGSLSATGKGHGTDKAVLAGLLGKKPAMCESTYLDTLFTDQKDVYYIDLEGRQIPFSAGDIHFEDIKHHYPYSNTMIIMALFKDTVLLQREYYSVGGGFLQWKGWVAPLKGTPVHMFNSMSELVQIAQKTQKLLPEIMMENEKSLTGYSEQEIKKHLLEIINVMCACVQAGLSTDGSLKGPYGLERRAACMLHNAMGLPYPEDRFIACISAYGQAAAEENAQGHKIVTAPTAGSAGVLPALVYMLINDRRYPPSELIEPLMTSAAIGILAKNNASISGAEVGCQGEIGVASAMAAALVAQALHQSIDVIENAAELALEHHLGMTCDPVGGYVQIPCISRCAMGAVRSWNAYLMATIGIGTKHPVKLDVTIQAMANTGRDMNLKYRETAGGGLAAAIVSP